MVNSLSLWQSRGACIEDWETVCNGWPPFIACHTHPLAITLVIKWEIVRFLHCNINRRQGDPHAVPFVRAHWQKLISPESKYLNVLSIRFSWHVTRITDQSLSMLFPKFCGMVFIHETYIPVTLFSVPLTTEKMKWLLFQLIVSVIHSQLYVNTQLQTKFLQNAMLVQICV